MENLHTLQGIVQMPHMATDKPAVVALHADGITRWTYRELADSIRRLAYGLAQNGVQPGDRVALLATNRPEWIVACLAIVTAGGVVIPIDTQIGQEALDHVLGDSGAQWMFTTTDYVNRVRRSEAGSSLRCVLFDVADDDERGWRVLLSDTEVDLPPCIPDDQAALFYTSGTTGVPKGVPLTHRNLVFQLTSVWQAKFIYTHDSVMLPLPMYHVYPFSVGLMIPMSFGMTLVLPQSLTGPQIVRALQEGKPTIIVGVPRLYRALFAAIESQLTSQGPVISPLLTRALDVSIWARRRTGRNVGKTLLLPVHKRFGQQLRMITSGGSALDPDLAWKLAGLGWDVAIGYGLTETAPLLTMKLPASHKLASVGPPLSDVELKIDTLVVSEEGDSPASRSSGNPSQEGEVLARGPGVFAGYRNLPDQANETFTEDGWFRTGDLGYLDDEGYLYISGRASTLIVTEGGKNIQPEPVEEIYQRHEFIQEIGIFQHDNQLVALIVPEMEAVNRMRNGDVERAMHEAINAQSQQLPTYQRISDFATTPEPLPKTNLGKLRRHKLVEQYELAKQGIVDTGAVEVGPLPLEDMSEQDRELLERPAARQVWDWLAERYADRRLTPDINPQLDLGIDSLSWLNLTLDIRQRTGVELNDEAVKRINTVRDLLQEVSSAAQSETASTSSIIEQPEQALSDEQQKWLMPHGPVLQVLSIILFLFVRLAGRWYFRIEAKGLENLPERGNFVITPNHTSFLDAPAIGSVLSYTQLRRTYWAGSTDIMFQQPIMRLISRVSQTMPVGGEGASASSTGMSSLALAAITVKRSKNLIWFPEGRVAWDGKILPFRQGIGMVLDHYHTPVVPVYIEGARDAMPHGVWLPRPRKIKLTFGQPCDPRELEQQGEGDTAPARIVDALHDRVAELMQPEPQQIA